MKIIKLDEIIKYFYMAGISHMELLEYSGNIHRVIGKVINTLTNESESFCLKLREDDSIVLITEELTKVI
jgi:hypothetical protein